MQTIASRQVSRATVARPAQRVASVRVVCKASSPVESVKKIAAAVATLPAMIAAHPAYALVDERMNGDGTGKPLGVNDEQLVFAMLGVFTLIWSLWLTSQKDLGDFTDVDDGLKID